MTSPMLPWSLPEPTEQEREWQRYLEANWWRIISAFALSPDEIGEPYHRFDTTSDNKESPMIASDNKDCHEHHRIH
jgi:hypothetical protein